MRNTNLVVLIGNLVRDAELKQLPSGKEVLNFSIAVNENFKSGDEWKDYTSFCDIQYFGNSLSKLQAALKKGTKLCITGALRQERWETDGNKFSKIVVRASQIEFCGGLKDNNSGTQVEQGTFQEDIPF
jgi:single-strand DNA-binding protein